MLVLASGSPRRRRLLAEAGIEHTVSSTAVDESLPDGLIPEDAVLLLAERKARAATSRMPGHPVLGADTVVVQDGHLLGKPGTPEAARRMLTLLSGRTHRVLTGIFLLDPESGQGRGLVVTSLVTFRELSRREIEAYVRTGEPLDKAGAYGIQGGGAAFVTHLEGSHDNVVGLPIEEVRKLLEELR